MTSPEQLPTSAQTARRQLVRGMFAAPALLTVYSGGALAAGSAKRCLVNQTNTPTMPGVTATDGPPWLRVQLRQNGSGSNIKYWVKGQDLAPWKKPGNIVYLPLNQWHEFNVSVTNGNRTIGDPKSNVSGAVASNPAKWAALRFDAAGNVVGVGAGAGLNQSALAGTCWMSVAPLL